MRPSATAAHASHNGQPWFHGTFVWSRPQSAVSGSSWPTRCSTWSKSTPSLPNNGSSLTRRFGLDGAFVPIGCDGSASAATPLDRRRSSGRTTRREQLKAAQTLARLLVLLVGQLATGALLLQLRALALQLVGWRPAAAPRRPAEGRQLV